MSRLAVIIVIAIVGLAQAADARPKLKTASPAELRARLSTVYDATYQHGVGVNGQYLLMGINTLSAKPGARLILTKQGAMVRTDTQLARVSISGRRITVTERRAPRRGRAGAYQREILTLEAPGLAVSSTTFRAGGRQSVDHHVMWKNSAVKTEGPLSSSKLDRLAQELRKPGVRLRARAQAIFKYRSLAAIPGLELKGALRRMGLSGSVDWR